jgi:hypothetical protein
VDDLCESALFSRTGHNWSILIPAAISAMAASLTGIFRWKRFASMLPSRQIDDLRLDVAGDFFQLCPAQARLKDPQIGSLNCDDGKARASCALPNVMAVTNEYFTHGILLENYW